MKAKRLLREHRGIKQRLEILKEEIIRFELVAEGTTANLDGQPHGSGVSDKMAAFSVRAADARGELDETIADLNRKRWEIIRLTMNLTDGKQIAIIRGLYLDEQEKGWLTLADNLGLSVRQVQRIHGEALEELERIMEEDDGSQNQSQRNGKVQTV